MPDRTNQERTSGIPGRTEWSDERGFWEQNYASRPYARDRSFREIEPGYRYGFESAHRHRGRDWQEVEPELRRDWDGYEHRGENRSTWEDIKASVRDAWDRVTGSDDREHERELDRAHDRSREDRPR
jgi:hypothetical protein